ncbi:MAG TPA: DUF1648 domain-containing protein [Terracidiphilus sp.]|nr:DUF1648 domain-containing protein [Terracidiphilus sp.]
MRRWLETVGLAALFIQLWMAWMAVAGPHRLPNRIPTHFDAAGNPNGWGSPTVLLFLVFVATSVYVVLTVVARFPARFNYPVRVTARTQQRVQDLTLDMLSWFKAELASLFAVLQWGMIKAARSGDGRLHVPVVTLFIVVLLGTGAWYLVAVLRAARTPNG